MTVTVHMALSDHKKINIQKDGVCARVRGRDDQHRLLRWRRGYPFRPGTIHKVSLGLEVKGNGNQETQPLWQAESARAIKFVDSPDSELPAS